jgi:hypothetical protein
VRRRRRQRPRRLLHRHQAAVAAGPRAGPGAARGGGAAAARLRVATPVRPRHRGVHRPRRRVRHRLLRHPLRRVATRPRRACAGACRLPPPGRGAGHRGRPRRRRRRRCRGGRRHRRQHGCRPGDGAPPRRRAPVGGHLRRRLDGERDRGRRRHRGGHRVRGRERRLPADGHHHQRGGHPRPQARWLGVDHQGLADLALDAPPGAGGTTLLPYYGGERTPNRPGAVGTWTGLTPATTRADLARAAYEALLCSLADAVDRLVDATGEQPRRLLLVGGATRSAALRALAPAVLGRPVTLPPSAEYVALGAARQAAWALSGAAEPPVWPGPETTVLEAEPTPHVREVYADLRERTAHWSPPAHRTEGTA